jgi:hypothetical protein
MDWVRELGVPLGDGLYIHNLRQITECCERGMKAGPAVLPAYVIRSVIADLARDWEGRAVRVDEVRRVEAEMRPVLQEIVEALGRGEAPRPGGRAARPSGPRLARPVTCQLPVPAPRRDPGRRRRKRRFRPGGGRWGGAAVAPAPRCMGSLLRKWVVPVTLDGSRATAPTRMRAFHSVWDRPTSTPAPCSGSPEPPRLGDPDESDLRERTPRLAAGRSGTWPGPSPWDEPRGVRTPAPAAPWLAAGLVVAALLALPFRATGYWVRVLSGIFMFGAMAQSLNIIAGFTGYADFGNVVFFGLGAYTTASLMTQAGLAFVPAWALGGGGGGPARLAAPAPARALLRDRPHRGAYRSTVLSRT